MRHHNSHPHKKFLENEISYRINNSIDCFGHTKHDTVNDAVSDAANEGLSDGYNEGITFNCAEINYNIHRIYFYITTNILLISM